MALLIFAAIGFVAGRWLGTTRRGFVTMAVVSIGATALQVAHLATTRDRLWMTLLPLGIGAIVVAGMLLGALLRRPSHRNAA
jgi:hypothetical protein